MERTTSLEVEGRAPSLIDDGWVHHREQVVNLQAMFPKLTYEQVEAALEACKWKGEDAVETLLCQAAIEEDEMDVPKVRDEEASRAVLERTDSQVARELQTQYEDEMADLGTRELDDDSLTTAGGHTARSEDVPAVPPPGLRVLRPPQSNVPSARAPATAHSTIPSSMTPPGSPTRADDTVPAEWGVRSRDVDNGGRTRSSRRAMATIPSDDEVEIVSTPRGGKATNADRTVDMDLAGMDHRLPPDKPATRGGRTRGSHGDADELARPVRAGTVKKEGRRPATASLKASGDEESTAPTQPVDAPRQRVRSSVFDDSDEEPEATLPTQPYGDSRTSPRRGVKRTLDDTVDLDADPAALDAALASTGTPSTSARTTRSAVRAASAALVSLAPPAKRARQAGAKDVASARTEAAALVVAHPEGAVESDSPDSQATLPPTPARSASPAGRADKMAEAKKERRDGATRKDVVSPTYDSQITVPFVTPPRGRVAATAAVLPRPRVDHVDPTATQSELEKARRADPDATHSFATAATELQSLSHREAFETMPDAFSASPRTPSHQRDSCVPDTPLEDSAPAMVTFKAPARVHAKEKSESPPPHSPSPRPEPPAAKAPVTYSRRRPLIDDKSDEDNLDALLAASPVRAPQPAPAAAPPFRVYWERQSGLLCGMHCINAALQTHFFTQEKFNELGAILDEKEREFMREAEGGEESADFKKFMAAPSVNVSRLGNYSLQVLRQALLPWGLKLEQIDTDDALGAKDNVLAQEVFIVNRNAHWFTLRKKRSHWFNLNSLLESPIYLTDQQFLDYMGRLRAVGDLVFVVVGKMPDFKEPEDHAPSRLWVHALPLRTRPLFAPRAASPAAPRPERTSAVESTHVVDPKTVAERDKRWGDGFTNRQACSFGLMCFRTNPQHFRDFRHDSSETSRVTPSAPVATPDRPEVARALAAAGAKPGAISKAVKGFSHMPSARDAEPRPAKVVPSASHYGETDEQRRQRVLAARQKREEDFPPPVAMDSPPEEPTSVAAAMRPRAKDDGRARASDSAGRARSREKEGKEREGREKEGRENAVSGGGEDRHGARGRAAVEVVGAKSREDAVSRPADPRPRKDKDADAAKRKSEHKAAVRMMGDPMQCFAKQANGKRCNNKVKDKAERMKEYPTCARHKTLPFGYHESVGGLYD